MSYEVVFDVISGGNTDVEVCLSSTTSWNPSAESGARGVGTGHSLIKNYNSEDDNLYLIIRKCSQILIIQSYMLLSFNVLLVANE